MDKLFFLIILGTLGLAINSSAQCVRMPVKASGFRGRVYSVWGEPRKQESLEGAKVSLLDRSKMTPILEKVTDKNGQFSAKVHSGRYHLKIAFRGLQDIYTPITVRNTKGLRKTYLLIELAPPSSGTDSCTGEIKVELR